MKTRRTKTVGTVPNARGPGKFDPVFPRRAIDALAYAAALEVLG